MTTKKQKQETPSVDTLLAVAEGLTKQFNTTSGTRPNEKQLLNLLTYTLQNLKETQEENKRLQKQLKK